MSGLTPSQTVGPYFRIGLDWPDGHRIASADCPGERVVLRGQVFDGDGVTVSDALIEIWQADSDGQYHARRASGFRGLGRCAVDSNGGFRFETIKPGAVSVVDGRWQAPHFNLLVMARGLLQHLYTRVYFPQDGAAQEQDSVLRCVPRARRTTLIARAVDDEFLFDIHLQGEHETVFFAI